MTVPVVVVIGLLLGGTGSGDNGSASPSAPRVAPPLSVSPPADTSAPTIATCAQLISALPLRLDGQDLRRTTSNPPSSSIVAWGDPAIVLRCGVARPSQLHAGSSAETVLINGVTFLADPGSDSTRYTVIDRALYVDVDIPSTYNSAPLPTIAASVTQVFPKPVCTTDPNVSDPSQLCTRRK